MLQQLTNTILDLKELEQQATSISMKTAYLKRIMLELDKIEELHKEKLSAGMNPEDLKAEQEKAVENWKKGKR